MCTDLIDICAKLDLLDTHLLELPTRLLEVFVLVVLFWILIKWVYGLINQAIVW